jgi:hypothetical protein
VESRLYEERRHFGHICGVTFACSVGGAALWGRMGWKEGYIRVFALYPPIP